MLTFIHQKGRFNYRTVGIAFDRERVLIHRAEMDDFWTLPGGRVEFGEAAPDALVREFHEELSISVTVERLLWVAENFFEYDGLDYHEIAFYFLVNLPQNENNELFNGDSFIGYEDNVKLIFQWQPVGDLKAIKLYPAFLQDGLNKLPDSMQYIIQRDIKD